MEGVEFGVEDPVDVTHDYRSVDYSSTGEYILSASTDGTLKMWDTAEEGGATQSYFDAGTSTWVKVRKYSRPTARWFEKATHVRAHTSNTYGHRNKHTEGNTDTYRQTQTQTQTQIDRQTDKYIRMRVCVRRARSKAFPFSLLSVPAVMHYRVRRLS